MKDSYEPSTIVDQPVPLISGGTTEASGSNSGEDGITTKVIQDKVIPKTIIAVDVTSDSLDTQTRAIKGSYSFEQMGALQIGSFASGLTGQILISPDGIVALDKTGASTITVDGITGDVTIKGTLRSGSVITGAIISGDITVGGTGNGDGQIHVLDDSNVEKVTIDKDGITINGGKLTLKDSSSTTIIDSSGLVSTNNFDVNSVVVTTPTQTVTSTTAVDIDSLSFSVAPTRSVQALLILTIEGKVNSQDSTSAFDASGQCFININGTNADTRIRQEGYRNTGGSQDSNDGVNIFTATAQVLTTLSSGSQTIKGQTLIEKLSGADPKMSIFRSSLTCIRFGK